MEDELLRVNKILEKLNRAKIKLVKFYYLFSAEIFRKHCNKICRAVFRKYYMERFKLSAISVNSVSAELLCISILFDISASEKTYWLGRNSKHYSQYQTMRTIDHFLQQHRGLFIYQRLYPPSKQFRIRFIITQSINLLRFRNQVMENFRYSFTFTVEHSYRVLVGWNDLAQKI